MTLSELRALAASTGFPNPNLAAAVAMAESKGNPSATNIVTNPAPGNGPERSFGLWQINTLAHPSYDETSLLDPTYNAQAAFAISHGGMVWKPWSTFTSGKFLKFYVVPTSSKTAWIVVGVVAALSAAYVWSTLEATPRRRLVRR